MNKTVYSHLWDTILRELSRGNPGRAMIEPRIGVLRSIKAGEFKVDEQEYGRLMSEAVDLSRYWQGRPEITVAELAQAFLVAAPLDRNRRAHIAKILTDQYVAGPRMEPAQNPDDGAGFDIMRNPRSIYQFIQSRIYGQEEAVRAAAMLVFNHARGRKRNILFIGPTGCGKTEIWRVAQQIYPHIRIVDGSRITQDGWSGIYKVHNIFDGLTAEEAAKAIIVIDEMDKLCEPNFDGHGTNVSHNIQNELLKLLEDGEILYSEGKRKPLRHIQNTCISFVFCGAFELLTRAKNSAENSVSIGFGGQPGKQDAYRLYDSVIDIRDLAKYSGMRAEIAGRIGSIVQLRPMTVGDYLCILDDRTISPVAKLERQYNIRIQLDAALRKSLAEEAAASKMGVRYLASRIQDLLDREMFTDCGKRDYTLCQNLTEKEGENG